MSKSHQRMLSMNHALAIGGNCQTSLHRNSLLKIVRNSMPSILKRNCLMVLVTAAQPRWKLFDVSFRSKIRKLGLHQIACTFTAFTGTFVVGKYPDIGKSKRRCPLKGYKILYIASTQMPHQPPTNTLWRWEEEIMDSCIATIAFYTPRKSLQRRPEHSTSGASGTA